MNKEDRQVIKVEVPKEIWMRICQYGIYYLVEEIL